MRTYEIFLLATIFSLTACSPIQNVTVVRHGEKTADGLSLSDAGTQRASRLKDILHSQKIYSIYSTNTVRTISTAQATADDKNLPVAIYKDNVEMVKIINNTKENSLLIVGHSNTVPDLLRRCGCDYKKKDLDDNEFDKIFVMKIKGKSCKLRERIY